MSAPTAEAVRDLRHRSGAGMMACKRALEAVGGDVGAALDWLRREGLAKNAKRAGRVAAEGAVCVHVAEGRAACAQVNCETDFVARNEAFLALAARAARAVWRTEGDAARALAAEDEGETLDARLGALAATLGEKITLSSARALNAPSGGGVAAYVHNKLAEDAGGIVALVAYAAGKEGAEAAAASARQVAMHVAAANPLALDAGSLDPAVVERERAFAEEDARKSGKPEAIVARMVEGRVKKFCAESSLVDQAFVVDPSCAVGEAFARAAGEGARLVGFVRVSVGDEVGETADGGA